MHRGRIQARVAAADDQAHARKHFFIAGEPASVDVGLEVVDGQERNSPGQANCLGGYESHEQGAGQAGRIGNRHGIDVFQSKAGFVQGFVDYGQDALRTWALEAISGTTPPKRRCSSSCEATTEDSTSSRSVTIAAAVSSQVVSRARMFMVEG